MRVALLAAVAASFLSFHAATAADPVTVGELELTDLWARATPPRAPAAGGFLTVTNHGATPDHLVAVSTPLADIGEVHEMKVEDGVMTMRQVEGGIEIPAGGSVTLKPGGLHLMFMDLKQPFVKGESIPVTITFEKAGSVETSLTVMAIGAPGMGAGDMDGEGMDGEGMNMNHGG